MRNGYFGSSFCYRTLYPLNWQFHMLRFDLFIFLCPSDVASAERRRLAVGSHYPYAHSLTRTHAHLIQVCTHMPTRLHTRAHVRA